MSNTASTDLETRLKRLEERERGVKTVLILGFVSLTITVVASLLAGYGALVSTQSTLLTAFQTGVTLHEAR
jgi:hypothetical protein